MDLSRLNERQKEAVLHTEGPLCVLAGAGSGKTMAIAHRIANIIEKGNAPSSILAITFTNKAASEMRERVNKLLNQDQKFSQMYGFHERPFVKTFHSLGVHILRENHFKLGLEKNFSILDRDDSIKIIKRALEAENFDPKENEPGKILSKISRLKGDLKTPDDVESLQIGYLEHVLPPVWRRYEQILKQEHSLDFDDLLLRTVQFLKFDKQTLKHYQKLWKFVHIDEYQDTNEVQYELTKMFAAEHRNICVVGDVDQNIYSWRGATIKNILAFEEDYPEAKIVLLEQNYRSTKNILRAANAVIEKNTNRKKKTLFTQNHDGEKITVYNSVDEGGESKFVSESCQDLIKNGVKPSDIVVLYRANFQSRTLEEWFMRKNVPYKIIGTKFYERKEVKDIISYIKASLNFDDKTSLSRIINVPARGIGKTTLLRILENKEHELSDAMKEKIYSFRNLLRRIKEHSEKIKPRELIAFIIKESGLEDKLKSSTEEDRERLENMKELASIAKKYDHLEPKQAVESFLEEVALSTDQDELQGENEGGVRLMTVHAAKGLEFEYVFVVGMEQGLFPFQRDDQEDDEEERRLFYVAVTRAKKKLFLTWASMRTIFGSLNMSVPSEFLGDIEDDIVDEKRAFDQGGNDEDGKPKKREFLIIDF